MPLGWILGIKYVLWKSLEEFFCLPLLKPLYLQNRHIDLSIFLHIYQVIYVKLINILHLRNVYCPLKFTVCILKLQDMVLNLQNDREALKTSLGLLELVKQDDNNDNHGFLNLSSKVNTVTNHIEQVMCKQIRLLHHLGAQVSHQVQPEVRIWCRAQDACTRYQRDAVLLTQLRILSENLLEKYINFVYQWTL